MEVSLTSQADRMVTWEGVKQMLHSMPVSQTCASHFHSDPTNPGFGFRGEKKKHEQEGERGPHSSIAFLGSEKSS